MNSLKVLCNFGKFGRLCGCSSSLVTANGGFLTGNYFSNYFHEIKNIIGMIKIFNLLS